MTRLVQSRRVRILAVLAAALLGTTAAWAYWVAPSSGNGSGHVGTLAAPSIAAATPGSGTVTLSWATVTAPGNGAVSYYVTRDGGAAAGNCPVSASPSGVTSCTDSGLAGGTHTYTVTALYRSWSARSAEASANVTVGAVDHLVLSAASTSPTAGVSDSLTITAKDSAGATVTSYTGSKSLTFGGASTIGSNKPTVTNSSGTATTFGTPETITFTNGVATVSSTRNGVMTLSAAETADITVTDGTFSNGSGTTVTVAPAATKVFALSTPSPTAGSQFTETLSATDQYGNATPSYTGSHTLTFENPAKSPNSKSPSYPGSVSFTSGTGTAAITLYDAQTTTLSARESFSGPKGTSASFTVAPASAASFSVANPGSQTAASAFNATITAKDLYGNTASSYEGSRTIGFSGPGSSPSGGAPEYPSSVSFTAGSGSASIVIYDAGSTTLTATESSLTGTSSSFTVGGASPVSFTLPTPSTQTAGTSFNETITAKDIYGNNAGLSGKQTIAFSGPGASPEGKSPTYPSSVTFSSGVGTAERITIYDAGASTLTATQGSVTGSTASFSVNAASASQFSFATIGAQTAGVQFAATLTAEDEYGNLAKYEGSKAITFTGPKTSPGGEKPSYPSTVDFSAGVGTAQVKLYNAAASTFEAAQGTTVEGSSNSFAVGAAETSGFAFGSQAERTAGTSFNETLTATDAYGNATSGYAGSKAIAFSGAASSPSGKAPLYPAGVTFAAGVGTAQVTLYAAGATTLEASDGTSSGTSAAFKVAATSATALSLSTPAPTVGTAFTETLTEIDAYGNAATGVVSGSKTVTFSGPGNGPNGKTPSYPSTVSFSSTTSSGTASITLYKAGATVLTATQGTLKGSTPSFTVGAGAPSSFAFGTIGAQAAGTAFNVTLTATDAGGNPAADGAKTLTFKGPGESPSGEEPEYPVAVTFTGGTGTASVKLYDATTSTALTAELGTAKGTSGSFAVNPLTGTKLAWTSVSGTGAAGEGVCLFTCTWTGLGANKSWRAHVSVTDLYGNAVSGLGSGHTVTLAKTISGATLSPTSLTIASTGEATSTAGLTYTSTNGGWSTETLTAKSSPYTEAIATLKK
jgi:hypothetical protein